MAMRFFEDGFDYKKYIDERLLKIDDLEKRSQLRNVVGDMLLPFYEHIEESYQNIEDRMFTARNENQGSFQIVTGIEERSKIDVTDTAMVPMRMEDMEEKKIPVEELLSALEQEKSYRICTVFVNADYSVIRDIEQADRKYRAEIITDYGEYPASVKLRRNREYMDIIKRLYQEFVNNGIEWNTVCAPYLHKIFDVEAVSAECSDEEQIQEIKVYFEEYEPYIRYHYVPLWNIRSVIARTSAYPSFCLDRIHYEHCIYGNKLRQTSDYMVAGSKRLWSIYRTGGDLYIQCDEEQSVNWELREFGHEPVARQYALPLMKNTGSIAKRQIRTVAEAKYYVERLGCGDYISLVDINQKPHTQKEETYDCDDFIIDEIRKSSQSPALYFEFAAVDKASILTRDIMSYAVSRLQLIYPEYNCKGILV